LKAESERLEQLRLVEAEKIQRAQQEELE